MGKCPLCQNGWTLEITDGLSTPAYQCRNCKFVGDGVQLYQAVHRCASVLDAAAMMVTDSLIPYSEDLNEIVRQYEYDGYVYSELLDFWRECQASVAQGEGYASSLLQKIGAWDPSTLVTICESVGACTGKMINDHFDVPVKDSAFYKSSSTYLVVPKWECPGKIISFEFIRHDFQTRDYAPTWHLKKYGSYEGIGLLPTVRPNSDMTVVCRDALPLIRLLVAGAAVGYPVGLAVISGETSPHRLMSRRTLYLNAEKTGADLQLAKNLPEVRCPTQEMMLRPPAELLSHIKTLVDYWHDKGLTAYQLIARELLLRKTHEAVSLIQMLSLSQADIVQISAAAVDDQDRVRLSNLFRGQHPVSKVSHGGKSVLSSTSGWALDSGEVISDTMFYIERIIYDCNTDTSQAAGSIHQSGKMYQFTGDLDHISSKTYDWLTSEMIKNKGEYPIVSKTWRGRLFDISLSFRKPQTCHVSSATGWVDQNSKLILPGMVISDGRIESNTLTTIEDPSGAGLTIPGRPDDQDLKALSSNTDAAGCFWALFAATIHNLMSPHHSAGTCGIALVAPEKGTVSSLVDQMMHRVGLRTLHFQSTGKTKIAAIQDQERESVLPAYIPRQWAMSDGFSRWLNAGGARNCLVPMARSTALCTALDGGWIYIDSTDDSATGQFSKLWSLIPDFVAWAQTSDLDWQTVRSDVLSQVLISLCEWMAKRHGTSIKKAVARAEKILSSGAVSRESVWGSKFLAFVGACILDNQIPTSGPEGNPNTHVILDEPGDVVSIPYSLVSDTMRSLGFTPPAFSVAASELSEIEAIVAKEYKGVPSLVVKHDAYLMYYLLSVKT